MRLSYIFIEEYGVMKKLELNFDPVITYSYDFNNKKFIIRKNRNSIKNFFDPSGSITNITAIVGANGAGKTSTLEFIKEIYGKKSFSSNRKFIMVYSEKVSNNKQKNYVYYHNSLIEKIEKNDEIQLIEHPYSEKMLKEGSYNHVKLSDVKTPCIFFSNIFDGSFEEEYKEKLPQGKRKQIYNISTNFLVRTDREIWKRSLGKGEIDQIKDYNASSVLRQLEFISGFDNFNLNFNLPRHLYVRFSRVTSPYIIKGENSLPESYRQAILDLLKDENLHNKFIELMVNNYFYELLELIDYKKVKTLWEYNGELNNSGDKNTMTRVIQLLSDWKLELERIKKLQEKSIIFDNYGIEQVDAMINLIKLLNGKEITLGLDRRGIKIEIKNELEFLKEFVKNFFLSFQNRPYASFEWSNSFSSGQKAMIDLYSRFYSIKKEIDSNECHHILILIDEGEVYLHPQWQKSFISNIITFLKRLFPNKITQIILTSNSPILLSDLPKECVIFLKEVNGEIKIVDGLKDKNPTFAANIHSLFSDSFFLKGDLIGDFAKSKINWLINILNGDIGTIRENEEVIRKMINMIGEPLIKNKLLSMLEDQLKIRLINVDEEIEHLKRRIEKLEGKKGFKYQND